MLFKVVRFFCVLVLFSAPLLGYSQDYKGKISPNQPDNYAPIDADSVPMDTLISKRKLATHQDSAGVKKDSATARKDSTLKDSSALVSDSTLKDSSLSKSGDTLKINAKKQKHDIETTIKYTAEDSITMDMATKTAYLYKKAKIVYGTTTMDAERVEIDWGKNVVTAKGLPDSTGKLIGVPVFHEKTQKYQAEVIKFNFKTKKGIISKIVTKQGDGYVHGDKVKRDAEGDMYVNSGKYTTCDLPIPHFYIEATKLKMIPGKKMVSGPFIMKVAGVPTPLGFFLGYFPLPKKKKSGIIFPTIGEQAQRGFYLSQGGYYWAPNDYMGIKIIGDVYSNGNWRANVVNTYKKRYCFNGSFSLSYGVLSTAYTTTAANKSTLFNLVWQHSSVMKRGRTFSANVNIASNKNYSLASYNPTAVMSNVFSSTVSYNKNFVGTPFNMSVNARQDENVHTKTMNLTLPQVSINMNRIYPFKKQVNSKGAWYEKINIAYNANSQFSTTTLPLNLFTAVSGNNVIAPETTRDTLNPNPLKHPLDSILRGFAQRGQFGVKQTIPISTTFSFLKVFNVSPNATYDEYWYTKKTNYSYRDTSLYITNQHGFYRSYDYNLSTSLTTNIYGTFNFKSKALKAVRHTLRPTIAYVYHPNFANTEEYSNYQQTQISKTGTEAFLPHYTQTYPGGVSAGQMNGLTFSFINTLEAKVKSAKDTANPIKKISLLTNAGLSGNYNFKAYAFKLSTLSVIATTTLFGKINVNYNSILDPYFYVNTTTNGVFSQRRVDTLAIFANEYNTQLGQIRQSASLFKITSTTISLSGNVNPKGQTAPSTVASPGSPVAPVTPQSSVNYGNPNLYMDFNIPWNLFLGFNYNSSKQGFAEASVTKSLTINGDIRISDKWKIAVTSGYNIGQKAITMTTFTINRDLHCWQMSFYVIPFGPSQTYTFTLVAKSSMLHDLKLNKRSPGYIGQPY